MVYIGRLVFVVCLVVFSFIGNVFAQDEYDKSHKMTKKDQFKIDNLENQIDSILDLLTLEEKVALCHAQSKFSTRGVPRLGIPEVWMSDGPHGVRAEINWDNWGYAGWTNDSITAFPALTCLAAGFNPGIAREYGISVGEEALYREKDVLLGPGVNIYRTPLNGRNFEYMGEDPLLASVLAVPYIQGVQANGVAACIKHYALNNQELWRDHINVKVSKRALYEIYLPAFKVAVEEGKAWSVMGAYNQYLGQHCCHNEVLLNEILKQDWNFDGVVITDWGGAHDTKEAALYGLDMEMGTGTDGLTSTLLNAYENYYLANPFLKMLESGEVEEKFVDDKARRILRLMLRTSMNQSKGFGRINNIEHLDVARRVGQEGIVLLKNEKSFFPLDTEKEITIAVIGENATRPMAPGGGSSELKPRHEISPLQGFKERFKNADIIHSMGYASGPSVYGQVIAPNYDTDSLKQAAVNAAAKADLVIFVGGLNKNHHQDCEGGDRLEFGLPFGQDELLDAIYEVNQKIGMILISGNAVEMPWIKKVNAVMQAWYLGSESGHIIADVLSGDVSPSGKLPFSFPVKLEDNAAHYFGEISYPGDSIDTEYKEGILVGYRWHDTKKIRPQFAFGHGLSYTSFQFSEINTNQKSYGKEDTIKVSMKIKNSGKMSGAEVAQVYIGKTGSKVERAVKELKGFKKVHLAEGETRQVEIEIAVADLAFFNEKTDGWEIEKGPYVVYVGNASDQMYKKIKILVD